MQGWLRTSLRVFTGAFAVYACAGKSISRMGGDDSSSDDGAGGSQPGASGSVITSGKGGTAGSSVGGFPGKGGAGGTGVPRGGTSGFGGTSGSSGRGGVGGTGGDAGEPGGGFGPGGSGGCDPIRTGRTIGICTVQSSCISMARPINDHVTRNELAADQGGIGGLGGEGGAGGGDGDDGRNFDEEMMSARVCSTSEETEGFLAVDYYAPLDGSVRQGFSLLTGGTTCAGYTIGVLSFEDFRAPAGVWTTQCVALSDNDLTTTATVSAFSQDHRLRNLRFVTSCECPRQITRYTTCGNITTAGVCQ